MPARTILKERDAKPIVEKIRSLVGFSQLSLKSRVELEPVKLGDVVFVEGKPVVFRRGEMMVPVLVNNVSLNGLPKVVVDMGAVPHLVAGADVMAPGIRKIEGGFTASDLLTVVDEKHGKYLAVGSALVDSGTMAETKKGKVIENLHFVGDEVWEIVKGFMHAPEVSG